MVQSQYGGAIDCTTAIDTHSLAGKTAIVTGGINGIGAGYTHALLAAGAYVAVGDLDVQRGRAFEAEEPQHRRFIECNVVHWDDQVRLFQEAARLSPTGRVHYVVANAGIFRMTDQVFSYEKDGATKPEVDMIDVNLVSVLYTAKLAMHYFIKQNGTAPSASQEDTCLILISSGAGIHDCIRMPQYCATKWAMRGLMHGLRRTAPLYGSRVNVITPYVVKTQILSPEIYEYAKSLGVDFATIEDAGECLLRILSDPTVNGRSLFVTPRKWAPRGYIDLDLEDTEETELRKEIQADQLRLAPIEEGLFM